MVGPFFEAVADGRLAAARRLEPGLVADEVVARRVRAGLHTLVADEHDVAPGADVPLEERKGRRHRVEEVDVALAVAVVLDGLGHHALANRDGLEDERLGQLLGGREAVDNDVVNAVPAGCGERVAEALPRGLAGLGVAHVHRHHRAVREAVLHTGQLAEALVEVDEGRASREGAREGRLTRAACPVEDDAVAGFGRAHEGQRGRGRGLGRGRRRALRDVDGHHVMVSC